MILWNQQQLLFTVDRKQFQWCRSTNTISTAKSCQNPIISKQNKLLNGFERKKIKKMIYCKTNKNLRD